MIKNKYKIIGDYVEIYKGKYTAYLDLDDFNYFNKSRIYFYRIPDKDYVRLLTFKDGRKQSISRIILNENSKNRVVDHINGNPLDNRKSNLRSISYNDNMKNKFTYSNNNSSNIYGITYIKKKKIWVARIQVEGKRLFLGSSKDFEKVKKLRLDAEKKYFGELKQH